MTELTLLPLLGWALVLMIAVMSLTWWLGRKWNNYSIVDAVWAFSFFLVTLLYATLSSGWSLRRLLILFVVSLWSCRLAFFLARRIRSHHPDEDERYKTLRQEYGNHVGKRFYLFFLYQGVSVVLLSVPFVEICLNKSDIFHPIEWVGFAVALLSLLGEAVADSQASKFKTNPNNRTKTCDVGLWKYSRHPNYFFESCIWWGFFLIALGTPGAVYTIYAPLIILFLLLKVTGVPPSEAQALKKRGEEYRAYQKRTSVFVPWFPKKGM